MDMELSDDPEAWEILTQNLSQKHGVSRSISANEDHLHEMISILKSIKSEYSVAAAAVDADECILQELLRIPSWWSKQTMIITSWYMYVWKKLNKRQIGAQKTITAKSKFHQETEAKAREAKCKQEVRDTADKEERGNKKQISKYVIESTSTLKEMKEGFLKMTEYLRSPLNREITPNQLPPSHAADGRLHLLENRVSGLQADVDSLKENTALILQGQAGLRDLLAELVNR